jgi:hypothetical protein
MSFERTVVVKVGWGDHYQGENLVGLDGGGHYERFNFRRESDGCCYRISPWNEAS